MQLGDLGLDVVKLILACLSVDDVVHFSLITSYWQKLLHPTTKIFSDIIILQRNNNYTSCFKDRKFHNCFK
jgi:hypothetical protein